MNKIHIELENFFKSKYSYWISRKAEKKGIRKLPVKEYSQNRRAFSEVNLKCA